MPLHSKNQVQQKALDEGPLTMVGQNLFSVLLVSDEPNQL